MGDESIFDLGQSILLIAFSAVLTFMAASYWFNKNRDTAAAKALTERLATLEAKAAVAEQALVPISSAFQAILIKQLTHYHTPELDALLAKLDPYSLTDEEERRFYFLLEERTRDMGSEIDASERNAAKMLPYVIKRVKEETDTKKEVALQIVVVPMGAEDGADTDTAPSPPIDPTADPAEPA